MARFIISLMAFEQARNPAQFSARPMVSWRHLEQAGGQAAVRPVCACPSLGSFSLTHTQIIQSLVSGCLCCFQLALFCFVFAIKNYIAVNILDMCPGARGELPQGKVPRSGGHGYRVHASRLLDNPKLFPRESVQQ